jgi:hypothetical protein
MPSSETSRRLKRDRSARVSGGRKAEFIDFGAQNCISEALFGGEVGPFGSPFFDFGTDLLVLLQLKQLRGGR